MVGERGGLICSISRAHVFSRLPLVLASLCDVLDVLRMFLGVQLHLISLVSSVVLLRHA